MRHERVEFGPLQSVSPQSTPSERALGELLFIGNFSSGKNLFHGYLRTLTTQAAGLFRVY
jgi:hypothetical protein